MVQQGGDGILAGYGEARADERHLAEPQAFEKKSGSSSGSINVTDVDPDYPTDEDFATLRQVPAKIPWTAWTVAFIELCERYVLSPSLHLNHPLTPPPRFSYYGCTGEHGRCECPPSLCKHSPLTLQLSTSTSSSRACPTAATRAPAARARRVSPALWAWVSAPLLVS